MQFYYYQIVNRINKKFYIGITTNYVARFKRHIYQLKNNKHFNHKLQADWNKFGESNFDFLIEKKCDFENVEEAYELEFQLIKQRKAVALGYNILVGGMINPMYGESVREKMKNTKQSAVPDVYQLSEISENCFKVIDKFKSQREAQRETDCSQANISKSIREHVKGSGYYWIRESDIPTFEKLWKPKRIKFTPTGMLDEGGNIIDVHHNMVGFEKKHRLPKTSVAQAVKTGWRAGGFKFKAITEEEYFKHYPITLIL